MELRAKIVEAIESSWTEADDLDPYAAADKILSLPEIRDALLTQRCLDESAGDWTVNDLRGDIYEARAKTA